MVTGAVPGAPRAGRKCVRWEFRRVFWSDYSDFNYNEDMSLTLLVHNYNPIYLYKLAVIWSLWRYWCKLFYERDDFDYNRLANMTAEVMLMVRLS